jgi:hypothetical protein
MSENNFDIKLQNTLGKIRDVNHLMNEAESKSLMHKDDHYTRNIILSLKKNLLNQDLNHYQNAISNFENPPKIIQEINGQKIEVIDQEILKKLQDSVKLSENLMRISQNHYQDALLNSNYTKNLMLERELIKNILDTELNQLINQSNSLVNIVRKEGKSSFKYSNRNNKDIQNNESEKSKIQGECFKTQDQQGYFRLNSQVQDFHHSLDSNSSKTSHMSIEAVDDN